MRWHPFPEQSTRRPGGRAGFAATFPAAATLTGAIMPPAPAEPPTQLVRWVAEGHDGLLVADREHDRIQACDARDGWPLVTLDRETGLGDVDQVVLEGHWLVVLGSDGPTKVRLPELRPQLWARTSR